MSNIVLSQISISYLGQDLNKNVLIVDTSALETKTLSLKKGQILINDSVKGNDLIVARNYDFVYNDQEPLEEKVMTFSVKKALFPQPSTTFTISPYTITDSTSLKRIDEIEKSKIYGDEAQIYFWTGTKTGFKQIYNWKQDFIYESRNEGKILLLGLVGEQIEDTLYEKNVQIGSYKVAVKKVSFGNSKGNQSYQIIDANGSRAITDPSKINMDSLKIEIPFVADIPKVCPGSSLSLYDSDKKIIKTFYTKKLIKKGKYFERLKYTYFGYGDEQFTAILKNKKGAVLHEETHTYGSLNRDKVKNRGTVSYLKMSLKYTSKKPEQRTKCTIENEDNEVLAVVYSNKNIHTGVNKIDYTFKHLLPEGQEVTIYVRNRPGRIIAEQTYTIK